jgi:hypothetical protein
VFVESSDGSFGGVDTMVMWRDQLDHHLVGADVLLNRFGAFVVHDVQCWLVVLSTQNSKDFSEGGDEGGASAQGHWADNDGVEVIDVGNKDVIMFLNDLTGRAPVRSVYMVPVMEFARAAKQNISWAAQASWAGNIQSTLALAKITSACLFRVDAVLERWRHMWHLLVAVDRGRWVQINADVSPGMVCSSVLLSRASRRVAAGGEHSCW